MADTELQMHKKALLNVCVKRVVELEGIVRYHIDQIDLSHSIGNDREILEHADILANTLAQIDSDLTAIAGLLAEEE